MRIQLHLTISGSFHGPKKVGPNSFYRQIVKFAQNSTFQIWWLHFFAHYPEFCDNCFITERRLCKFGEPVNAERKIA